MSDELEVVVTQWLQEDLLDLPKDERERVQRAMMVLQRKGWLQALQDQTVKHLRDGIHELRVLGHGAAFRVLFFLAPGRSPRLIVLTSCIAKSVMLKRRRMDAEVERAVRLRAAWLAQQ